MNKLIAIGLAAGLTISGAASASTYTAQRGVADRADWENWLGSLSGDYHDGALYWSERSAPKPGACYGVSGWWRGEWTAGCLAAQQILGVSEVLRKSDPDYRLGWNSYPPPTQQWASPPNPPIPPSIFDPVDQI
jgi:hypothetical protein